MTVTLTDRLGLTRWGSDSDAWSREQIVGNFDTLDAAAIIGTQGTNAERPTAGVQRRLYLATDAERVYLDDGDEWLELPVLSTANTWTGAQTFDDVEVGGTFTKGGLTVATTTDVGAVSTALGAHLADTSDAHDASAISFAPAGDVAATDVQAAIAELATEKATSAALTAHLADTSDAHDATAISYAGAAGLSATTVEAALDELATEKAAAAALTAHIDDTTDAHDATAISYAGAAGLSATDVEAALDELDTEKAPKAAPTFTGTTTVDALTATGNVLLGNAPTDLIGFYGAAGVARPGTYNLTGSADRTLGAYASDAESAAYAGVPAALADAATRDELNQLRAAYENLRTYVEDLGGVAIATATDLKTLGLVG